MTQNELKRCLPNASKSFLKLNVADPSDRQTSGPEPKHPLCDDPVGPTPRKESDSKRFVVRITSFRRRLLDPDNLFGGTKYFTDGLRYAGLLPGDTEEKICLEVSQQKVKTKDEECTRIEIEPIIPPKLGPKPAEMTRDQLIEAYWAICSKTWNRPAFNTFMETLTHEDLCRFIQAGS